jgi:hypothetical protein
MDAPLDPAAVFACAKSLYDACFERKEINLSEAYHGGDGFMREVMRVGNEFEKWACDHVAFEALDDVWPYLLEDRFGMACLEVMGADMLAGFDADDCLRIAFNLRLPMWMNGSLPLPVCVEAPNPVANAEYQRLRIQTVRHERTEGGGTFAFTENDDPFDENFAAPVFAIYGVLKDGLLEHLVDMSTYDEARRLLGRLLPGIGFPEKVVAFSRQETP